MSELTARIEENLANVRRQIAEAAARSGRSAADIKLVAVSKYVGIEAAAALLDAGCQDLGESRPQELWRKGAALQGRGVNWHLIGHLQRNKVRRTLPWLTMLHACDSLPLLEEIDRIATETGIVVAGLLEVNISGDVTKHGFVPHAMPKVVEAVASFPSVRILGLMGMSSLEGDLDDARRDFERLRLLRDQLRNNSPPSVSLDELSMGMSDDFTVAIEEGATLVRVGSALFEGIVE